MILESISFKEIDNKGNEWSINNFSFEKINLIVGKNSTGKSRTLNVISALGGLVAGERPLAPNGGDFEVNFKNDTNKIKYTLEHRQSIVVKEKLIINDEKLLDRELKGEGVIYAKELDSNIKFQVPETSLACVARRDSIQHPYFEDLYDWGRSIRHYYFGSQLGKDCMAVFTKNEVAKPLNAKDTNNVVAFFKKGIEKYGQEFEEIIVNDINNLGYKIIGIDVSPIDRVTLKSVETGAVNPEGLTIKEEDHLHEVDQTEISQGLFRAISLFIQLRYSEKFSEPSLILIDDIGEGLDYERASLLINAIIDIANKTNVQLIMTTNDRFTMNSVPLEYWSVLQRSGGQCTVLNYKNSEELFDEFELTGLSNFDFFSSQYYVRKKSDRE